MAVLRKVHSYSVVVGGLIKKINNVKQDPRRKAFLNFIFPELHSSYIRF